MMSTQATFEDMHPNMETDLLVSYRLLKCGRTIRYHKLDFWSIEEAFAESSSGCLPFTNCS